MNKNRTLALVLYALVSLLLLAGASHANESNQIKYRQQVMEAIGSHTAAISTIVKGRLPLTEHVLVHAAQITALADLVPAAFENKATKGPTDAKPEIWAEMDKFAELNQAMSEASKALTAVVAEDDKKALAIAMRDLGKSCGACHRPYRKTKEESYKNQK